MKGKTPKLFGVVMALVLALSLAVAAVPAAPASADVDPLEWDEITIPEGGEDGGYVLHQWTDVGPIAMSPDGDYLFAAVYDGGDWYLFRSRDDGYSWDEVATIVSNGTANFDGFWDVDGGENIVDVVVAPGDAWEDDGIMYVATEERVYKSEDRGRTFDPVGEVSTSVTAGVDVITSLDCAYFDEDLVLAVGTAGTTDSDVYLYDGSWTSKQVETAFAGSADGNFDVLDVLLYGPSEEIIALVTSGVYPAAPGCTAIATQFGGNDFGDDQGTVWFKYGLEFPVNFNSTHGMMGVADDFAPAGDNNVIFAAITAWSAGVPRGDVFRCKPPAYLTSNAVRLYVGAEPEEFYPEINFWSIAVSGNLDEASIIAGTELYDPYEMGGAAAAVVHHSQDGGASWDASAKRPTSWNTMGSPPFYAHCYVISGSTAYAGTRGQDSGFSVSEDGGVSWNQRAFIDCSEDYIVEYVAASPSYATDETMFMVTSNWGYENSLWKTSDGGDKWERIFSYSLTGLPPVAPYNHFDIVELAPGWPTDPAIFVFEWLGDTTIWESPYGGTIFLPIGGPPEADTISAWQVLSATSALVGDGMGTVWRSDDLLSTPTLWDDPEESEIPGTAMVTSIEVGSDILVGTDSGEVFISTDDGVTFEQVGDEIPELAGDWTFVETDVDYETNSIIYAGGFGTSGVFRFEVGGIADWECILDGDFEVTELKSADDGTLYATGIWHNGDMYGGVMRTVNPTVEDADDMLWEFMDEGLPGSDDEGEDLMCWQTAVVPGSSILIMPAYLTWTPGDAPYARVLIFVDTLSGMVLLENPADGTTSGYIMEAGYWYGNARVTFTWEGVDGAELYQIQVALDEDFGSIVDDSDWWVTDLEGTVVDMYLALGTTFYWRVRVVEPLMSLWSETWDFTTPLGPGAARPTLESPSAGQEGVGRNPTLEWTGLIDATSYELMVAEDCDWANLVVDKTGAAALGADTIYVIAIDLDYGTTYCWKVRALSETTESPWSDVGTFYTMAEPIPEEAPVTPLWVWVVIGLGAVLAVAVIVLIMRTRKPV